MQPDDFAEKPDESADGTDSTGDTKSGGKESPEGASPRPGGALPGAETFPEQTSAPSSDSPDAEALKDPVPPVSAKAPAGRPRKRRRLRRVLLCILGVLALIGIGVSVNEWIAYSHPTYFYDRIHGHVYELRKGSLLGPSIQEVWPNESLTGALVSKINRSVDEVNSHLIVTERWQMGLPVTFFDEMNREFLLSPNAFEGYDLADNLIRAHTVSPSGAKKEPSKLQQTLRTWWEKISPYQSVDTTGLSEEEIEKLRTLIRWRNGVFPAEIRFPQAWIRISDPRAVQFLEDAKKNREMAQREMEQLATFHPADPIYPVFVMDLALLRADEPDIRRLLERHEPTLAQSGQPFFEAAPRFYRTWLKEMERDREGRNLPTQMARLFTGGQPPVFPGADLVAMADAAAETRYDDSFFTPDFPLLLRTFAGSAYAVPNFLEYQVLTKTFRVLGEFRLFQGDADGALDLILPWHRIGVVMMRAQGLIISGLIGMAIRSICIQGVQTAFLDGMRTPENIMRNWPRLEEAYRADLEVSQSSPSLSTDEVLFWLPSLDPEDREEAVTRNLVSHARMALAHSAVAARYQLLTTGEYPSGPSDFGPLLSEGADPDPFTNFALPLRILQYPDRPFVVYSVGPDREDQLAEIAYDPTNGTISRGDLFTEVPRERTYPFPPPGQLATTRDGILAQFPNGLPPDPFADRKYASYAITDTHPAWILSWGPDTDQKAHCARWEIQESDTIPPALFGLSTYQDRFLPYPGLVPGVAYDPTNGTVSEGDLFFCTTAPDATMLDHTLPPTPTPFPGFAAPTPTPYPGYLYPMYPSLPAQGNPFAPPPR